MTGFDVIRAVQDLPLPYRDRQEVRGLVMALDKNKSLTVAGCVEQVLQQLLEDARKIRERANAVE